MQILAKEEGLSIKRVCQLFGISRQAHDIAYIETRETTGYLSLITAAYSRRIMGYHLHHYLHTDGVLKAWNMALRCRSTVRRLVHHSDRGLQYCAEAYQKTHRRHGILCSMTDGYDCYQNALADRINGILKTELLTAMPQNLEQATTMVQQAIYSGSTLQFELHLAGVTRSYGKLPASMKHLRERLVSLLNDERSGRQGNSEALCRPKGEEAILTERHYP